MGYNEARLRSMSIEETVEVEEYGDLYYDHWPVTSENQRRHHQRINDGSAGTGSLSSRHAREERSTRPQKVNARHTVTIKNLANLLNDSTVAHLHSG